MKYISYRWLMDERFKDGFCSFIYYRILEIHYFKGNKIIAMETMT